QGGFALDRREPFAAAGELEHPRLAAARLARQPDLAAQGLAERAFEQEVLAAGDRLAWLERQLGAGAVAAGDAFNRPLEAVTDPRHGDDPGFAAGIQGLAQLADRGGEHVVHGDPAGPDRLEQFLL